jgi:hypothetical protein
MSLNNSSSACYVRDCRSGDRFYGAVDEEEDVLREG